MRTSRRQFLAGWGWLVALPSLRVSKASLLPSARTTDTRRALPFGEWRRLSLDPILGPRGDGFESAGVFNPAVIVKDGRIVMLYRAQDRGGTSRLGYAASSDGVLFTRRPEPVLVPEADYERGGGVEDPRLVQIHGAYYLTYTGYNTKDAQLCLAVSRDLLHWERQGVILPAHQGRWNVGWTKSGAILPEKINGKYWMYYLADAADGTHQMGVANSSDLLHWTEVLDRPVLAARRRWFDSQVVEPGPPPVMTEQGILLVYNGADDTLAYSTGWVLFQKSDPTKVLARCEKPIFRVEREWERVGQVPNVVFVEGWVQQSERWLFYYGGADKYVGVAAAAAVLP
jgi:beta-1,2-mannosidase